MTLLWDIFFKRRNLSLIITVQLLQKASLVRLCEPSLDVVLSKAAFICLRQHRSIERRLVTGGQSRRATVCRAGLGTGDSVVQVEQQSQGLRGFSAARTPDYDIGPRPLGLPANLDF